MALVDRYVYFERQSQENYSLLTYYNIIIILNTLADIIIHNNCLVLIFIYKIKEAFTVFGTGLMDNI